MEPGGMVGMQCNGMHYHIGHVVVCLSGGRGREAVVVLTDLDN